MAWHLEFNTCSLLVLLNHIWKLITSLMVIFSSQGVFYVLSIPISLPHLYFLQCAITLLLLTLLPVLYFPILMSEPDLKLHAKH